MTQPRFNFRFCSKIGLLCKNFVDEKLLKRLIFHTVIFATQRHGYKSANVEFEIVFTRLIKYTGEKTIL